jgi:hypothetical protein
MQKLCALIIGVFISVSAYSQQPAIITSYVDARVLFGINRIKAAAKQNPRANTVTVHIVSDAARALSLMESNHWKPFTNFDEQCYAIRISTVPGKDRHLYVLAGETTGAMYGALDIAEAISCNTIDRLQESDNVPYIKNRGIKFNIPLDLRTPGYSDPGDSFQQNIGKVWDTAFWKEYFDEMAIHRYNVMTVWSLQPFPSMIKVPEFPETSLKDVWRTKEKYDDTYSSMGLEFDRPHLFRNVEVV